MKRRLFKTAAALSLLLFVALMVGWVRSDETSDQLAHTYIKVESDSSASLITDRYFANRGRLTWLRQTFTFPREMLDDVKQDGLETGWTWESQTASELGVPNDSLANRLGFGFRSTVDSQAGGASMTHRHAWAPFWCPALLTAAVPSVWLAGYLRRRRRQHRGLCPACGYDVRATPDRCPECGRALTSARGGS